MEDKPKDGNQGRLHNYHLESYNQSFLSDSVAKNLPAMQEMWVQSVGQKDYLEKEMTTHSSILAWEIPWTEKPGGL